MTPQNVGITDLSRSAYESACRDFWRASVKMDLDDRQGGESTSATNEAGDVPTSLPCQN
jgi:hypothetical protein